MKNKEEIIFNCQGLIATWLYDDLEKKNKSITDLRLICDGDCRSQIIPCNIENAGELLGNILYQADKNYKSCKLLGVVDKENKEFGKIEIN